MSKKKWICMALALAALVCGMTFVGCENGTDTSAGTVVVNNRNSSLQYWAKTSEKGSTYLINPQRSQPFSVSLGSVEEGDCTVYYCVKEDGESTSSPDANRVWSTKSCRVAKGQTTNVYIPY